MSIKAPKEGDLVKQCLLWLQLNGYTAFRMNSGAMKVGKRFVRFNGMPGISDIIGWTPASWGDRAGVFLAIETKRRGQKPTAAQQNFLDALNRAGGIGLLVRSLDDLIGGLRNG